MKTKPKTKSEQFIIKVNEYMRRHANGCPHCEVYCRPQSYNNLSSCQKLLTRAMIKIAKAL